MYTDKTVILLKPGSGYRELGDIEFTALHHLDKAVGGDEDQPESPDIVKVHNRKEGLCGGVVIAQVVYRRSLVTELSVGHLLGLQNVNPACISEYAQAGVAHTVNDEPVLLVGSLLILLIDTLVYRSGISEPVHQENTWEGLCLALFKHNLILIAYLSPAGS